MGEVLKFGDFRGTQDTPIPMGGDGLWIPRSFNGRSIIVGTSPTKVIEDQAYTTLYIMLNTSRLEALTSSGIVINKPLEIGGVGIDGNTQATPISVANGQCLHLFLDYDSVAFPGGPTLGLTFGQYDFYLQTQNPITLNWVDVRRIFVFSAGIVVPSTPFYDFLDQYGVATKVAIRWHCNASGDGSVMYRISYTLKRGFVGDSSGVSQAIYIGNNENINRTFGYPVLESQKLSVFIDKGVSIWGIADTPSELRVFSY